MSDNIDLGDIELNDSDIELSFNARCRKLIDNTEGMEEARLLALEELCGIIAKEPSIMRRGNMIRALNAMSGAGLAVIKSTVADIIDAEKRRIKEEGAGLGLPPGVDDKEALEFGIYQYNNRYWAIGAKGKYEISNFTMKVLFHVKTSDVAAYRIIEITNVYGKTSIISLNTDDFVSLGSFKKVIARFGNYIFKGVDSDLGKLQEKIQREEKPTRLVQTLGYNKRGNFYAFANGIVPCGTNNPNQLQFIQTDDNGIIETENQIFFIPANSKIFEDKDAQFTNDKKFIYQASGKTNFEQWSALHYRVYGDKSMAGTLFYVSAIFRDIIHPAIGRRFPLFNCCGQKGSGKGTYIESYLWLFGQPQDQIMLGGASTVVGFMRKFAQFCNAFVWLDEYKNNLPPKIIESLKNLYDGIGYERGKKDNTFETESIPINSACILSGQEIPVAEPALFSRCIMMLFKPGKGYTDESRRLFKQLQQMQEGNLSHITAFIALHRKHFIDNYKQTFENTFREVIQRTASKEIDERMMLNVAMLCATYKVADSFLKFPFTYEQAEAFLIKNMKEQYTILAGSDDVSKWWQVVENLFTMREIVEGRDFELKDGYLYIRIQQVHGLYLRELRSRNDSHYLDKSTLEHYLEMDPDIQGEKTRARFNDGTNTSTFKCLYSKIGINLIRRREDETDEQVAKRELYMGKVIACKVMVENEAYIRQLLKLGQSKIAVKRDDRVEGHLHRLVIEFDTSLSLDEIKALIQQIPQSELMQKTIALKDEYTGLDEEPPY